MLSLAFSVVTHLEKNYEVFSCDTYRVDQQCCLSGDPPETLRRGSPDFLAQSLVIPAIYTKFKLITHKFKLEFCIYGWNYQWLRQKIRRPPAGGSPDDFRRDNIAGPHSISYLTKVRKIENRGLDSTGALASAILKEKVILCTVVKIIRDTKKLKILLTFSTRNIKILTRSLQK